MDRYQSLPNTEDPLNVKLESDSLSKTLTFFEEDIIKSWKIVDSVTYPNYNQLTLTSHRLLLETCRTHNRSVDSSLVVDENEGGAFRLFDIISMTIRFFQSIFSGLTSIVTKGSEAELSVVNKNVLLKDVINLDVKMLEYSELVEYFIRIFYFCLLSTLCLFISRDLATILGLITILQIATCAIKFKFWSKENMKDRFLPNLLFMIAISVLIITFIILCSKFGLDDITYWWFTLTFGILSIALSVVLIRFNIGNRQQRGSLIITSKRGTHGIGLRYDDAQEARQFIWRCRSLDVPSFNSVEPN